MRPNLLRIFLLSCLGVTSAWAQPPSEPATAKAQAATAVRTSRASASDIPEIRVAQASDQDVSPGNGTGQLPRKKKAKRPLGAADSTGCAQPATATTVRGIDPNGNPFIETVDATGAKHHRTKSGEVITFPDGRRSVLQFGNAPMPTPPLLPADAASGRKWFDTHNAALLALISETVHGDANALSSFSALEAQSTKGDVQKQIYFRTDALQFLAGTQ